MWPRKYLIGGGSSSSSRKICIVLDTGALLAKYHLLANIQGAEYLIPIEVYNEVKDAENREALELGLAIGRIRVEVPDSISVDETIKTAKKVGELVKLSQTDIAVAALALSLKKKYGNVVVVTDDYSLQNLLHHMGIGFKPLRTMGIRKPRKYRVFCPVCGYVPSSPQEQICPLCGSKIIRREAS
ncbi:MAG: nucleotide-binding protein [Crenarchaeota archaeon]|nr:nucleotide-binding protein [Thermoproteota archaeon]